MTTPFDTRDNGEPTSAHKWDEQFREKGERPNIAPPEKLRERISQLKQAIQKEKNGGKDAAKIAGWEREIAWRMRQLAT